MEPLKRYNIYQVHDNPGWDCEEDDNGDWMKAEEVIAHMQEISADLAVSQLRIAELEAANERQRKAIEAGLRISQTGQESLRRIAELEAKLRIAESNFENLCYDIEHDGFDANNAV